MGDVDYYLGICFNWRRESDGHVSVHMSQEGYANAFIDEMGLQNAVTSPKMTPYRSGLPIDSLPKQPNISKTDNETLRSKFRSFMGMLNWLSILQYTYYALVRRRKLIILVTSWITSQ
jgi:hypothetical protein